MLQLNHAYNPYAEQECPEQKKYSGIQSATHFFYTIRPDTLSLTSPQKLYKALIQEDTRKLSKSDRNRDVLGQGKIL